MAAKTTQRRSADSAARRKERGIEDLRLAAPPGTKAQLAELMQWHGVTTMAEAMSLMILNTHALGREGSANLLAAPRHEIHISENVARTLRQAGARAAARMDEADQ